MQPEIGKMFTKQLFFKANFNYFPAAQTARLWWKGNPNSAENAQNIFRKSANRFFLSIIVICKAINKEMLNGVVPFCIKNIKQIIRAKWLIQWQIFL